MAGRAEADVVVGVRVAVAGDRDDGVEVEIDADDDAFVDAAAATASVVALADGVCVDGCGVLQAAVVRRAVVVAVAVGGRGVLVTGVTERDAVPVAFGFAGGELAGLDDRGEAVVAAVVTELAEDEAAVRAASTGRAGGCTRPVVVRLSRVRTSWVCIGWTDAPKRLV
jgi:hypothetical protein